jgi:hypothetical protein
VDILAKNGVDISVSEGDQQGNYVALLGNILFPLIAFGGLFFLFRRAQVGGGTRINHTWPAGGLHQRRAQAAVGWPAASTRSAVQPPTV